MRRRLAVPVTLFIMLAGCRAAPTASNASTASSEYRIDLVVSDDLSRIDGVMSLRYVNTGSSALDALQFFLFPNLTPGGMRIESCSVDGKPSAPASAMRGAKARVALSHPLEPGAAVEVVARYSVQVPTDPKGEYGGFARTDSTLAMAWCYPLVLDPDAWLNGYPAPYADYLVKEPSAYTATLSFPERFALAGPCAEMDRSTRDGRTRVTLRHAPARDFFAALGSAWTVADAETGGTRVRSFAPAGREAAARFAADQAALALECFKKRFGPYPFGTFTVAAVPLASYGLEFPGIIAVTDRIYDLAGEVNGIPNQALLEGTVAHETAHQWFYGMVGNDQVHEPWVDESLAQYATWLYFRDRRGAARAEGYYASFQERWSRVDRREIPIGLAVDEYSAKEYGAIVYGRGPLFLETLSNLVGERTFDAILREWVRRYTGRTATGADFQRLASEVSGRDLSDIFNRWVWRAQE
jgi:hypothetical protein